MKDIQKSEYDMCSLFVLLIPGVLCLFYFVRTLLFCDHIFKECYFFVITFILMGWCFVITLRGVVFMHPCCKKDTLLEMLQNYNTFL